MDQDGWRWAILLFYLFFSPTERLHEQMPWDGGSVFCLACQCGLQRPWVSLSPSCLNSCLLKPGRSFLYNLLHPRPEAKITENILGIFTVLLTSLQLHPQLIFPSTSQELLPNSLQKYTSPNHDLQPLGSGGAPLPGGLFGPELTYRLADMQTPSLQLIYAEREGRLLCLIIIGVRVDRVRDTEKTEED